MKTKITISSFLVLLVISILYLKPGAKENEYSSPQSTGGDDPFIIGAWNSGKMSDRELMRDSANFNLWHRYTDDRWIVYNFKQIPQGWTLQDSLYFLDSSDYLPTVKNILDDNWDYQLRTYMNRTKIDWLSFGQRSDYQCEKDNIDPDFWFYSYNDYFVGQDLKDSSQYGNREWVRYCEVNPNQTDGGANWVVRGLKANREQVNTKFYPGVGDGQLIWFIKPRIRIDSTIVDNYPNTNVCRIEVLNFDSVLIKSVIIKAEDFQDQYYNYNGNYLEEYLFLDTSKNLEIDTGYKFNPDRREWNRQDDSCKVDFRVYWYGQCDMWIDYVRVEDEIANRLLTGEDWIFEKMLWLEAELAKYNGSPYRFYNEEHEFNHLPCLKYVSRKLAQLTSNSVPYCAYDWIWWYSAHTPGILPVSHFKQYFINSVGIEELLMGAYPFKGQNTKIPITLLETTPPYPLNYEVVQPVIYDEWLQNYFDNSSSTSFISYLKSVSNVCKQSGINFISPLQTHIMHAEDELREPTNQEIELMINLSVSYGTKGIMYFWYDDAYDTIGSSEYCVGLADRIRPGYNLKPRYYNVYGQEKWQSVKDINAVLKKWSPYLMSFDLDNTESYIYRDGDERYSLLSSTYFLTARTFYYGSGTPSCNPADTLGTNPHPDSQQSLTYDCPEKTYLQVALFDDDPVDYDKYFMIVNRRCSPVTDSDTNGGRRFVRVLFDANDTSSFPNYNNWNIIDVENESKVIVAFDKRATSYLDLGWFMPGEGRLYRIVPASK